MSRILFLNRLFGPNTEATGTLLAELAEDLAARHADNGDLRSGR